MINTPKSKNIRSNSEIQTVPEIGKFTKRIDSILNQEQQTTIQEKIELSNIIEGEIIKEIDLQLEQSTYDYSDYEDRLGATDEEIEKALQKLLTGKLGELYSQYFELNSKIGSNLKRKKINNWGLIDLIYENVEIHKLYELVYKRTFYYDRWIKSELDKNKYSYHSLNLQRKSFSDLEKVELLNIAKEYFIQKIDFSACGLWAGSTLEGVVDFTTSLGNCGLKSIILKANQLSIKYGKEGFYKIIKAIGQSGIKYCDISSNRIMLLGEEGVLNLFKLAGIFGIKAFIVGMGYFTRNEKNKEILFKGIELAGINGVRHIGLKNNYLFSLSVDELKKIITIAGKAGIKSLDLSENVLSSFSEDELKKLVTLAGKAGIKCINLSNNDLREELKKELVNLVSDLNITVIT